LASLVRVASGETDVIKPVLDAGGEGIIMPQIKSAGDARKAVDDCRYPPVGKRGFGPCVPGNYGRTNVAEIVENRNRSIYVAVMVETKEAYDDIENILAIEGLDAIVFGPMDSSFSLGVPMQSEHPLVLDSMKRCIQFATEAGVDIGAGAPSDPEVSRRMFDLGIQWIQIGRDFTYMVSGADRIRQSLADILG
jgi:4-hydroxy-2-oxoheptanedioate aldolase